MRLTSMSITRSGISTAVFPTSLSRYIADRLNWSLGGVTGDDASHLRSTFRQAANKKLVLSVQDVDTHFSIAPRDKDKIQLDGQVGEDGKLPRSCAHLGDWLDVLQGDIPLDDQVVIFTTNHLENIDPAFYRPGRVDVCEYVGNFSFDEAQRFYQLYYETSEELGPEYKTLSLPAANIASAFTNNPRSPEDFKAAVLEKMHVGEPN